MKADIAKQRQRRQRGKKNVRERKDFKALTAPPARNTADLTHKTPHELKMLRYRDRVMALVLPLIKAETDAETKQQPKTAEDEKSRFDVFEKRSLKILGTMPANSEIALFSDLLKFLHFCVYQNSLIARGTDRIKRSPPITAFPAQPWALELFIGDLLAAGQTRGSIERCLGNLAKCHAWMRLPDPRAVFDVQDALAKARLASRRPKQQAEGLRFVHLQGAVHTFDADVLRDVADITLLFTAFDTLCRRSELAAASWPDYSREQGPKEEHTSGLLYLPASKTDQDADGAYQYLSPVACDLLDLWRDKCGLKNNAKGAIFRGIYSNGSLSDRLSEKGINRAYKRIAERLGFSSALFSGHSTRVGAAQEMIEAGLNDAQILLSGRWKSTRMLVTYGRKIRAKQSGAAVLAKKLGTDKTELTQVLLEKTQSPTPE